MKIRSKGLGFDPRNIPEAHPFSSFPEAFLKNLEDGKQEDTFVEVTIMKMLSELQDDRERAIFLLQVMRGDGYNFDHASCAKLFKVNIRWYFRLIEAIQRKLARYNVR